MRRPSIIRQVVEAFKKLERYGQSRYDAKQEATTAARAAGLKGWNPARVDGIYSIGSGDTYFKEAIRFVEWAKETHHCRWLDEAKIHVAEYLRLRIEQKHSAWTLQMARSALRKMYQEHQLATDVQLPTRRKVNIIRSRGPKAMDKKFSEQRNRDLVDLCRASGLRRHEVAQLRAGDVFSADGNVYVRVRQGKGGRPRTVPVLVKMHERVLEIVRDKAPDEMVIDKIPVRADIHGYRREFTAALYEELNGSKFDPKHKNEAVLRFVSAALGHNRIDVVTRNYLG